MPALQGKKAQSKNPFDGEKAHGKNLNENCHISTKSVLLFSTIPGFLKIVICSLVRSNTRVGVVSSSSRLIHVRTSQLVKVTA